MRESRPEVTEAAQALLGTTLIDVNVKSESVELVFLGEMTFIVRITKEFSFFLSDGGGDSFNPSFDFKNMPARGKGDFVFLRGARCGGISLDGSRFSIDFETQCRLVVDLTDSDFEPIEFLGMSGPRHENLAFYHVL